MGSSPPSGYAPYPNCWRLEALRPACAPPTIEPTLGVTVNNWHGWNRLERLDLLSCQPPTMRSWQLLTTKTCESMWGWVKTYYYHIRGNNHPLTSHSRVPKVPEFWLIAMWIWLDMWSWTSCPSCWHGEVCHVDNGCRCQEDHSTDHSTGLGTGPICKL